MRKTKLDRERTTQFRETKMKVAKIIINAALFVFDLCT